MFRYLLICLANLAVFLTISVAVSFTNSDFEGSEFLVFPDEIVDPITPLNRDVWILGGADNTGNAAGAEDRWVIDTIGSNSVAQNNTDSNFNNSQMESQGMFQWTIDGRSTTGASSFSFDFRMMTNPSSNNTDYNLNLYVFGWNDGDTAPGIDFENPTTEDSRGDTFTPNDSVNLINESGLDSEGRLILADGGVALFPGVVDNGLFNTIVVDLDFGSGYDSVGVLFYGENSIDSILQIDNVSVSPIPEPSFAALVVFVGLAAFVYRRKRRKL